MMTCKMWQMFAAEANKKFFEDYNSLAMSEILQIVSDDELVIYGYSRTIQSSLFISLIPVEIYHLIHMFRSGFCQLMNMRNLHVKETISKDGFSWIKKGLDSEANQVYALKLIQRNHRTIDKSRNLQLKQVLIHPLL